MLDVCVWASCVGARAKCKTRRQLHDDMSSAESLNDASPQPFSMVTDRSSPNGTSDDAKFLGQKERRKSSAVKMFLGDYLSLATSMA